MGAKKDKDNGITAWVSPDEVIATGQGHGFRNMTGAEWIAAEQARIPGAELEESSSGKLRLIRS